NTIRCSCTLPLKLRRLIFSVLDSLSGQQNITARLGLNVILPCRTSSSAVTRIRVLLQEQSDKTYQHPSFKGRVELADSQIKDGNLSLILKNVIRSDAGTYECRVHQDTTRNKRVVIQSGPVSIVHLTVQSTVPFTLSSGQILDSCLLSRFLQQIKYNTECTVYLHTHHQYTK
uniref:Ig-like domain-containing protein n=1 Tax=Anabas testudineus TaxID=64144 RepID=A0A7N6B6V2_ANATE